MTLNSEKHPAVKQRLGDVSSILQDMAITTFDVDPKKMQEILPDDFIPEIVTLQNGRECALISAVTFFNHNFFVGFAPFFKIQCHQTNYRAYVRYKGKQVVWFFGTSLGTKWNVVPRHIWKMPWHYANHTHQASWSAKHCTNYEWFATGKHGLEHLKTEGTNESIGILDGFTSKEDTWRTLTHPFDGYLCRTDGKNVHYSVFHEPLHMERGKCIKARFTLFEELGLIESDQVPHSILLQQSIHYLISLPPKRYQ